MFILFAFTFASGLLTILAPCIWPLLPIILSSTTQGGKKRPLGITLGIMTSFALFTLTIAYVVRIFPFDVDGLRLLAVGVIAFMGITFIIPKLTQILEGYASKLTGRFGGGVKNRGDGFKAGYITGFSLGIVWSPCAGPILASIATIAATATVNFQVVLLTLVYVTGVGIPLFLFATIGRNLFTKTRFLSSNLGRIQQIFGVVMILTAVAIYTNYDKTIQIKLLDAFPSFTEFLIEFESNDAVLDQLDKLQGNMDEDDMNISKSNMNIIFIDEETQRAILPNLGEAPEIIGITNWIGSDPLTVESLKGKVVLIDFWTYTCINCIRTLPHLTGWYETYKDQGLVIIGIHSPEFEFEKDTDNVIQAMKKYGIEYPVAQDNDFKTWRNYKNRYWPAKYLIDAEGNVRYSHFGEGKYEETELAIRQLIAEAGMQNPDLKSPLQDKTPTTLRTPEIYLGSLRMNDTAAKFSFEGEWDLQPEYSESVANAAFELDFRGEKVFLVINPSSAADTVKVYLDGNLIDSSISGIDVQNGEVLLDVDRLYELIDMTGIGNSGKLRLEFSPGIKIFAFTFG